jgi:hypothetical protein
MNTIKDKLIAFGNRNSLIRDILVIRGFLKSKNLILNGKLIIQRRSL